MLAVPNITFNGQAEEAINFYSEVFGGKIKKLMRYEDEPTELAIPDDHKKQIAIAWLYFGDNKNIFTICDAAPGEPFVEGNNLKIDLLFEDKEIHTIFEALSKDGKIATPLIETFFSPSFGHITDKFGINWYLSVLQPPQ